MAERRPILCRLGIHQTFQDTLLTNYGTDEAPFWFGNTYETCNRCGWTSKPKPVAKITTPTEPTEAL